MYIGLKLDRDIEKELKWLAIHAYPVSPKTHPEIEWFCMCFGRAVESREGELEDHVLSL